MKVAITSLEIWQTGCCLPQLSPCFHCPHARICFKRNHMVKNKDQPPDRSIHSPVPVLRIFAIPGFTCDSRLEPNNLSPQSARTGFSQRFPGAAWREIFRKPRNNRRCVHLVYHSVVTQGVFVSETGGAENHQLLSAELFSGIRSGVRIPAVSLSAEHIRAGQLLAGRMVPVCIHHQETNPRVGKTLREAPGCPGFAR